jgi:hypothetical protein
VYGLGIDKFKEIMMLGNMFEILRKYGKTITYSDVKYQADEFEELLTDNPEFLDSITNDIIAKIKLMDNPEVEMVEEEEEFTVEPPMILKTSGSSAIMSTITGTINNTVTQAKVPGTLTTEVNDFGGLFGVSNPLVNDDII